MSALPYPPQLVPGGLFCFGLGYTCLRLARRLMEKGWTVAGTSRSPSGAAALASEGISSCIFGSDNEDTLALSRLDGVTHLIASIPPGPDGDPALVRRSEWLPGAKHLKWVGYLSTPAIYGDRQGGTVSEDDEPSPGSLRGERRLAAEQAWIDAFAGTDVSVQVFRLSGIYGPGRCALDQLRNGTARIIDKPGQVFNRIHVDDIGTALMQSMLRPNHKRIYNVADDEACASGDVVRYAAALLNLEAPEPIPYDSEELSPMARSFYDECKRLDTTRLREELGVTLCFPSYREGLNAIVDDETRLASEQRLPAGRG